MSYLAAVKKTRTSLNESFAKSCKKLSVKALRTWTAPSASRELCSRPITLTRVSYIAAGRALQRHGLRRGTKAST